MFDRFKKLVSGMVNQGMNQLETPEILAEQAQNELEEQLKKLKDALVQASADEKQIQKSVAKNAEETKQWEQRAAVAAQQNNDDVARQCLVKKQELTQHQQGLESQLKSQQDSIVALKEKYAEVEQQYQKFAANKATLTSRAQASDATSKAHELMSNPSNNMDKWERKIAQKEAMSAAEQQLAGENQMKNIGTSNQSSVDDELAAIKEQLGGGTPKLIVDKENEEK